ncbi:hypothetical protein NC652_000274 [Populus alba x Populus x berolinensis]|nr:hypothetical protein NC652_000274 [Populus alba x Populus x berolinensis]
MRGAGAPIAGSCQSMRLKKRLDLCKYRVPLGNVPPPILFGRHHKAVLNSPKPKLFVMGTRDGFTSVKQLQNKLSSAVGRVETHLIEGASHFQMEGPDFDNQMDLANGLHVLCHQNQLTIQ